MVLSVCKMGKQNNQLGQSTDERFARATRVWVAVNHNTSVFDELVWCLKRTARASEFGSCK